MVFFYLPPPNLTVAETNLTSEYHNPDSTRDRENDVYKWDENYSHIYSTKGLNKQLSYEYVRLRDKFIQEFNTSELELSMNYPNYNKIEIFNIFDIVIKNILNLHPDNLKVYFINCETISFKFSIQNTDVTYDVYLFEEEEDLPNQEVIFLLYKDGEFISTGEGNRKDAFTKLVDRLKINPSHQPRTISPEEFWSRNDTESNHNASLSESTYSPTRLP